MARAPMTPSLYTAPMWTYPWDRHESAFRAGAARLDIPKHLTAEDVDDVCEWLRFIADRIEIRGRRVQAEALAAGQATTGTVMPAIPK